METEDLVGINEDKLNALISEIMDIADSINKKFNTIEKLVSETKKYFVCPNADDFRNKFNEISYNFPVVNQNILNISYDLVKAKQRLLNKHDEVLFGIKQEVGKMMSNVKND